jgi:predicted nucleic acid-binding protein
VTETEEIIKEAEKFQKIGLKVHDSIHLSCAIAGGCDCFLSTDDRLLKHADSRIELMNPTDFLKRWEDNDNDE